MEVTPIDLTTDSTAGQHIVFTIAHAGERVGENATMEVSEFLAKFPQSEDEPDPIGTFQLEQFPALLAVLRDAGAVGPRSSTMARGYP